MDYQSKPGFYGKLPAVGDFVSRRLPREFIQHWDDWLQQSLAASRKQLGSAWLNSYLNSPIWRFLLSPGICGHYSVVGILMPSVDRVGRYFPLTLAAFVEHELPASLLLDEAQPWFEQLEDIALTGLEGHIDVGQFDQLLQNLPPLPVIPAAHGAVAEPEPGYQVARVGKQTEDAADGFAFGHSLWNCIGYGQIPAALFSYQGLPPCEAYANFLSINPLTDACGPYLPLPVPKQAMAHPAWASWAVSNIGRQRRSNQDAYLNKPESGLWVVADGMGGHQAGDIASQLVVDTLKTLPAFNNLPDYLHAVQNCLQDLNQTLRRLGRTHYADQVVGSTAIALLSDGKDWAVVWAGDSRLYRVRQGQLSQLTDDHSMESITTEAGTVKSSNIITRAIGATDELILDSKLIEFAPGDLFLLCSDGLNKELDFLEIAHIMQIENRSNIANMLVDQAIAKVARDNVTVIVIDTDPMN